ncbi:hypothetical protein Tco_1480174 [Tanacetum coccineum]
MHASSVDKVLHDIVHKIASNATNDLIDENLPRVVTDGVKNEREASKATVPALISKEFIDHAPKINEELFKIHMNNNVINVQTTTSTSTDTTTADLQHQLYLKMKDDAFHKHDHDDHQEDDAPRGRKEQKGKRHQKAQNLQVALHQSNRFKDPKLLHLEFQQQ